MSTTIPASDIAPSKKRNKKNQSLRKKNNKLAHKMRDLNYAIECDNTKLAKDIKSLLQEAIKDHKEKLVGMSNTIPLLLNLY